MSSSSWIASSSKICCDDQLENFTDRKISLSFNPHFFVWNVDLFQQIKQLSPGRLSFLWRLLQFMNYFSTKLYSLFPVDHKPDQCLAYIPRVDLEWRVRLCLCFLYQRYFSLMPPLSVFNMFKFIVRAKGIFFPCSIGVLLSTVVTVAR